jgi:hypothetical protein
MHFPDPCVTVFGSARLEVTIIFGK